MRDFKLYSSFLEQYKDTQPKWGPLGYVTYKRTYARLKPDGNTEEFWETCQRVVEGVYSAQKKHCRGLGLPWNNDKAQRSAQEMFRRMWDFKWLPPGRGLWMMGTDYVDRAGSAALNNCGYISTKNIKLDLSSPFCWMMDMLMLGVGVGFDTEGAGTLRVQEPRQGDDVFVVEDTREGWVALLDRILTAYTGRGSLPASVDYSRVRPAGSPILGFGGTASGPQPLVDLIESSRGVLDALVGEEITSEAIVDLANFIGRCVVAGNVRRSAEIAFGSIDDENFIKLKDPKLNGDKLISHRWASNNSVFAEVGMDYTKFAELTAVNGEPGYQWLSNAQDYSRMGREPDYKDHRVQGSNPCVEQSLEDSELCCLVESFPSNHSDVEDYLRTLKYAYLYAKSVTLISTHNERTNAVMMRNRRIGCSMSGIVQAMQKFGRRQFFDLCDEGYSYLEALDKKYSEWLCIPHSIKKTSVKPSGSVSLLPGVTPGIHYPHSEYYIRRIRFQKGHPIVQALEASGFPVEEDIYSPNTVVAEFPVKEELYDRDKTEVTMWEQLENAAQMQQYWADNQVSVTVTFSKEEAPQIKHALELYETRLKGVSFLPLSDHGYAQAPYETISKEEYERRMSTVYYDKLPKYLSSAAQVHDTDEKFCDGGVCSINLDGE